MNDTRKQAGWRTRGGVFALAFGMFALGAGAGAVTQDVLGEPRTTSAPTLCGDHNASGAITASDALAVLAKSIELDVELLCPVCMGTTTTTAPIEPTTTLSPPLT